MPEQERRRPHNQERPRVSVEEQIVAQNEKLDRLTKLLFDGYDGSQHSYQGFPTVARTVEKHSREIEALRKDIETLKGASNGR
jgi:predicted glycoside hydrolase/deacetylase ChbG (UPF0249 family)